MGDGIFKAGVFKNMKGGKMSNERIKEELFRWYDKEYLWKWEYVLDFVLHILALNKEIEKNG